MKINDYKNLRDIIKNLTSKVLNFKSNRRNDMIHAGKLLGFWDGQAMLFDSDQESDILMDFLIYEKNKNSSKLIDQFYDSDIVLTDIEEEVLEGMTNSTFSLFQILNIDIEKYTITIVDILDQKKKEYNIMDIGFSQTAVPGIVFFSRLLPIRELYITSGVSFGFNPSMKNKILSDIKFAKLKKGKKLDSTELYILAHKRNKIYGKEINKVELN